MTTYIINDIDGDGYETDTIATGDAVEIAKTFPAGHPVWRLISQADKDGQATGSYVVDGKTFTTTVIAQKGWKIEATYTENGNQMYCDRHYALGEYVDQEWETKEAAEAIANDLRSGVGTVVDASFEYKVVESF